MRVGMKNDIGTCEEWRPSRHCAGFVENTSVEESEERGLDYLACQIGLSYPVGLRISEGWFGAYEVFNRECFCDGLPPPAQVLCESLSIWGPAERIPAAAYTHLRHVELLL